MQTKIKKRALVGHWIHSHEEDSGGTTVFRRAGFAFPPSRGREGFELLADGTLIEHGIGPTDQGDETRGRWSWDAAAHRLTLKYTSTGRSEKELEVVSVDDDRLVVRSPG
jgi:hypothetical protein